jgi:mannosyltransferase OCH1-like enzyme
MNYYLIKNKYEKIKNKYNDTFEINIYYIDEYNCQISVKRLDSLDGWGLLLQIKIFDIFDISDNSDILIFGNSEENMKTLYFKTNIKLEYDNKTNIKIPNILLPRKNYLINNKYTYNIAEKTTLFIDLNIIIYYISEYKIQIIIRRLDEETGWSNNLQISLFDNDYQHRKEIIHINSSEINYKILFLDTKIKVGFLDHNYNQEIPKIIFQTGQTNTYKSILHYNSIMSFIEFNPEYTYIYYNDTDARKFLKDNFSDEINYSYDLLVPGAFKADLLRYCFLYNKGGCYFDCKQILKYPIRHFLDKDKTLVFCNDVIKKAILNAIIFSTSKNSIIENVIKDCVYNIINKIGNDALGITGPTFLYKSIYKNNMILQNNIILQNNRPPNNYNDFSNDYYNNNITLISNGQIIINRFYKGYYDNYLDINHYGKLFNNNEIYYKNFQYLKNYIICVYPNKYNDKFLFSVYNNKIIIKRVDLNNGWNFDLKILIINDQYKENLINVGMSKNNIMEINF